MRGNDAINQCELCDVLPRAEATVAATARGAWSEGGGASASRSVVMPLHSRALEQEGNSGVSGRCGGFCSRGLLRALVASPFHAQGFPYQSTPVAGLYVLTMSPSMRTDDRMRFVVRPSSGSPPLLLATAANRSSELITYEGATARGE